MHIVLYITHRIAHFVISKYYAKKHYLDFEMGMQHTHDVRVGLSTIILGLIDLLRIELSVTMGDLLLYCGVGYIRMVLSSIIVCENASAYESSLSEVALKLVI
jgi:hypothetical protein